MEILVVSNKERKSSSTMVVATSAMKNKHKFDREMANNNPGVTLVPEDTERYVHVLGYTHSGVIRGWSEED